MAPLMLALLCLLPRLALGQSRDPCPSGLGICFGAFTTAKQAAGSDVTQQCGAVLNVTSCLSLLRPLCSSQGQSNLDSALNNVRRDYAGPPKNCSFDITGQLVSVDICDAIFKACGNAKADPSDQCSPVPSHRVCLQSVLESCDPAMNSTGLSYIEQLKSSLASFNCDFDAVLTTATTTASGAECGALFTNCHDSSGNASDICSMLPVYERCAETVVSTLCDRQSYLNILSFIAQTQSDSNCQASTTQTSAGADQSTSGSTSPASLPEVTSTATSSTRSASSSPTSSPGTTITASLSSSQTSGIAASQASTAASAAPQTMTTTTTTTTTTTASQTLSTTLGSRAVSDTSTTGTSQGTTLSSSGAITQTVTSLGLTSSTPDMTSAIASSSKTASSTAGPSSSTLHTTTAFSTSSGTGSNADTAPSQTDSASSETTTASKTMEIITYVYNGAPRMTAAKLFGILAPMSPALLYLLQWA